MAIDGVGGSGRGRDRAGIAWRAALALTTLVACGKSPQDKLVGWPPEEEIVPFGLPEVVDAAPEPVVDTVAPAPPIEPPAPPTPPCRALVELACELWTPFADACREAQTRVPDDRHAATREACQALLDRHRAETRWGNPCGRYARALCRQSGEGSERCKSARARTPVLKTRREWNACQADLIWLEMQTLRR